VLQSPRTTAASDSDSPAVALRQVGGSWGKGGTASTSPLAVRSSGSGFTGVRNLEKYSCFTGVLSDFQGIRKFEKIQ
jgi:hypothetical protein